MMIWLWAELSGHQWMHGMQFSHCFCRTNLYMKARAYAPLAEIWVLFGSGFGEGPYEWVFRAQCADLTLNKTTNMDILKFTVTDTARQKIHLPVLFIFLYGLRDILVVGVPFSPLTCGWQNLWVLEHKTKLWQLKCALWPVHLTVLVCRLKHPMFFFLGIPWHQTNCSNLNQNIHWKKII